MKTPHGASVPVTLGRSSGLLGYEQALESPCATCSEAPCCTHLPLHTFTVTNLLELDHARYLLNFDGIVLGISAGGEWSVYYHRACRFLDLSTSGCTLHDTDDQPEICVHYNPYRCWYKRVLSVPAHPEFVRVDLTRMAWILERIEFDDDRTIIAVPGWEEMVATFATMPLATTEAQPLPADPVAEEWTAVVLGQRPPTESGEWTHADPPVADPCTGCDAYCCTTLVFPQAAPTSYANLDYLKFCLGFPGVEVGVSDGATWNVMVRTSCRHLEGGRCAVYGQPERPLLCRYYDETKCTYRIEIGETRPQGFIRLRLEHFDALASAFAFDDAGAVVERPPADALRVIVEATMQAAAG